jgi:hypothetical protein
MSDRFDAQYDGEESSFSRKVDNITTPAIHKKAFAPKEESPSKELKLALV